MSKTIIFTQNLTSRKQESWINRKGYYVSSFELSKSERISISEKYGYKFGFVLKKIKKN